ncbi:hypothetical protein MVEN_02649700 [Mycena venus]|uniref:Tetraspanin Tsp2 family n=1 Tax=Mycena venus TaxID=2733690 RepID=A0A8H6TUK8_9AGAR|nr:hypothetical protein MVEN_02649700 [Mycena venus]
MERVWSTYFERRNTRQMVRLGSSWSRRKINNPSRVCSSGNRRPPMPNRRCHKQPPPAICCHIATSSRPRPPFASADMDGSSRSSSPGPSLAGSSVSLQINYVPNKFSPGVRQRTRKGKGPANKFGGGVDAFRAGEARIPKANEQDYDGVDLRTKNGRKAKWNRFKWVLVCSNTIYTIFALGALAFILTAWFDVWQHADILRVGNRPELILTTTAAAMALLTALIGWAGIVLNNRGFLAVYTFFLWIAFVLLVIPGYITYKKFAFNLEGKDQQAVLGCCGYFSPFVEATVSSTCYSRSVLPGCKKAYLEYESVVLNRWFVAAFACVPLTIGAIIAGLLCSNHVTYRFGKGMMPKAYRLSEDSMAVIMDSYATQLAEQYGADMVEVITPNSNLESIRAMTPTIMNDTPSRREGLIIWTHGGQCGTFVVGADVEALGSCTSTSSCFLEMSLLFQTSATALKDSLLPTNGILLNTPHGPLGSPRASTRNDSYT